MKRLLFAAGLLTVGSTYSFGQSGSYTQKAVAQIPFDFQTGDVSMPAGKYLISESGHLLTVRGDSGKPSAMLLTLPAKDRNEAGSGSLIFTRYGNDYFLAKIWSPDSREGRAVPKGKREKELMRRLTFTKSDEVAQETHALRPLDSNK